MILPKLLQRVFHGHSRPHRRVAMQGAPRQVFRLAHAEPLEVRLLLSVAVAEFSTGITANSGPLGITLGPDGNLWFTEQTANQIGRITPDGVVTEFSTGISANSGPAGITAGPDGNLWFTEASGNQIGRITPAGVVTEFSLGITPGSGPLEIVAGPDGNLWFTEQTGNRIGRITPTGTVTEFSAGITANSAPFGIAVGPDGNIWFTEQNADQIGQITMSGVVTEFSAGITVDSAPSGITAGPDGNLWFTEEGTVSIGRITPTGTVTEFGSGLDPNSLPVGIVAGPDGNLWFTDGNRSKVGRITTSGTILEFATGITIPSFPYKIAVGPNNSLWITEFASNRIGQIYQSAALSGSISASFNAPTTRLATSQPVTLNVSIAPTDVGDPTPTGTVTFMNGATVLGVRTLVNGQASLSLASLPVGTNALTVLYSGDANTLSGKGTLTETVSPLLVESGPGGNTVTASGNLTTNFTIINYGAGSLLTVSLNAALYYFDPLVVTNVNYIGGSGIFDTTVVMGTAGSDSFTMGRGTIAMTGFNSQNVAVAVNVSGIKTGIVDGNGGNDSTILTTSTIDDVFVGAPGTSPSAANYAALYALSGAFGTYAYHSKVTAVYGGGTGNHIALLFTSQGDDNTVGVPTNLEMAGAGFGGAGPFDFIAQNYPAANAYNTPGNTGTHTATFVSPARDDLFVANSNVFAQSASASGGAGAFNNVVYHFTSVAMINTDTTATHTAFLFSSTNNDTFTAGPTSATLAGTTAGALYNFTVNGFGSVSAFNLGTGTARLTGTANNDVFVGSSTFGQMTNGAAGDPIKYRNTAYNFTAVTAITAANSTASMATLIDDTNGNNVFVGTQTVGILLQNTVANFARVDAYKGAANTGIDTAQKTNIAYVFRDFGNWAN